MPDQIGVVFCIYAVFKVKQGIFGAIGVREDCYSFAQRSLVGAFREVLRDVSNMTNAINTTERVPGLGT